MDKAIAFVFAAVCWVVLMMVIAARGNKKVLIGSLTEHKEVGKKDTEATNSGAAMHGVQLINENGVVTINIDPKMLGEKIQLNMNTHTNQVTMQVLPGGIVHEPTAEADIPTSELLTSPEEVDQMMLAQIQELANEGKVKFK